MAGTETKRIIELTEASTVQSGDFIAVDSNARGTKKVPTSALATSAALTAETNARAGADEQMSERMDGIEEQTALIQNPTKTLSGALVSFTDGADMPMVACAASIVPKQSGTGTPSPDNVRPISGWTEVNVIVSPTQEATDGTTTTVNLGRTVYGGTLDVVTGVLGDNMKYDQMTYSYLSGLGSGYIGYSANVTQVGGNAVWVRNWNYTDYPENIDGGIKAVCNAFPISMHNKNIINSQYRTWFGVGSMTSVAEFLSAVQTLEANGSGLWIAHEIKTPQTYQLTPTEVKTLLGENNVWADSGDVEITYRRDISIVINNLESALNG